MPKRFYLFCVLVLATGLSLAGCEQSTHDSAGRKVQPVKDYRAKDFSRLKGMEGFSDMLLENHFTLYQGYVKNTNMLLDKVSSLIKSGDVNSVEYSELKRRLGFEFNGMKLHELYFSNLGDRQPCDPGEAIHDAIVNNFGSFELWKKDFLATGSMRGIGWVVLYFDPAGGRLANFWINEHEVNHPAGCQPLLVMDVWEHAYMLDYQLDRRKYTEAFFNNIDWNEVAARYDQAFAAVEVAPGSTAEASQAPGGGSLEMTEHSQQSEQ